MVISYGESLILMNFDKTVKNYSGHALIERIEVN